MDAVAAVVAADVGGRAVHDLDIGTIEAAAALPIAAVGAVGDGQGAVVHQNIQRFPANDAAIVAIGGEGGAIGDVDEVGAAFVAAVNAVPCNGIEAVVDGQGGVVVHIELVAAATSHVDAVCLCGQTCAIHGKLGVVQRQGGIVGHADGVPLVIGRGAGPRHVNIHILEGEIGTPERDTKDLRLAFFRYELQLGLDGGFSSVPLSVVVVTVLPLIVRFLFWRSIPVEVASLITSMVSPLSAALTASSKLL